MIGVKTRLSKGTYNDTVLAYVNIGTNLGSVDNAVFFYEDVIPNVEREESNAGERKRVICSGSAAHTQSTTALDPQVCHGLSPSPSHQTAKGKPEVKACLARDCTFLAVTSLGFPGRSAKSAS